MDLDGEETVEEIIEGEDKDSAPAALILEEVQQPDPGETPYWVSIAKTGFTRLHRWKGCRVVPAECYSWKPVSGLDSNAEVGIADKACKLCWPPEEGIPLPNPDSDTDSSSGSSSNSTDSSAADPQSIELGEEGNLGLLGDLD